MPKQVPGFTAVCGMKNVYLFCQGRNKKVTVLGAFAGDVLLPGNKRGKNEESAVVDQGRPVAGDAHFVDAFCGANDNGLAAAQENFEAIFFNGRMESADEDHAGIAKVPYEVVGLEDYFGGAADRAKKGRQGVPENRDVSDGMKGLEGFFAG